MSGPDTVALQERDRRRRSQPAGFGIRRPRTLGVSARNAAVFAAVLPLVTTIYVKANPNPNDRIVNPSQTPLSMDEEGGGPSSPFFPSSAKTNLAGGAWD